MGATRIQGEGFLSPGHTVDFDMPCEGSTEGVAVILSDEVNTRAGGVQNQWIVDLRVKCRQGFAPLGRLLTTIPGRNGEPFNRVVCLGNVPGAVGWQVACRGPIGQLAQVELVAGDAVGAGFGFSSVRPRPVDFRFATGIQVVTPFDTVLLGLSVDNTDPATGVWFQLYNARFATALGAPIFSRFVPPQGHFDLQLDASAEIGDSRFNQGYTWATAATAAGVPAALQILGVKSILG